MIILNPFLGWCLHPPPTKGHFISNPWLMLDQGKNVLAMSLIVSLLILPGSLWCLDHNTHKKHTSWKQTKNRWNMLLLQAAFVEPISTHYKPSMNHLNVAVYQQATASAYCNQLLFSLISTVKKALHHDPYTNFPHFQAVLNLSRENRCSKVFWYHETNPIGGYTMKNASFPQPQIPFLERLRPRVKHEISVYVFVHVFKKTTHCM